MENIDIRFNKSRLIAGIILSILSLLVCFYLIYRVDIFAKYANPIVIQLIAGVSILFFTSGVVISLKKVLDNKLGLLIDEVGINVFTNSLGVRKVKWDEIRSFEINSYLNKSYLLIYFYDEEAFMNTSPKYKRAYLRSNLLTYGTPLVVDLHILKVDEEALLDALNQNLRYNRLALN